MGMHESSIYIPNLKLNKTCAVRGREFIELSRPFPDSNLNLNWETVEAE